MALGMTSRDAVAAKDTTLGAAQSLLASLATTLSDPRIALVAKKDAPEALIVQEQQQAPQRDTSPAMGMVPQQSPHITSNVFSPDTVAQLQETGRALAGVGASAPSKTLPQPADISPQAGQGPWATKISTTPGPSGGRGGPGGR